MACQQRSAAVAAAHPACCCVRCRPAATVFFVERLSTEVGRARAMQRMGFISFVLNLSTALKPQTCNRKARA